MDVTPRILAEVARDNERQYHIGDGDDDLSREDARERGFMSPEEAESLPITPEASGLAPDIVPAAGQVALEGAAVRQRDLLSRTVERRQKFSAPGAHVEAEELAARIRRETANKFHLSE